jgi:hypothetical protein
MSHQPFYRESDQSWAERQRRIILLPGQEICDCGQVIEPDQRHSCVHCGYQGCVHCGYQGCVHCLHWADDTGDADLDGDWVCTDECEIEWLQSLARSEDRSHRLYQDWMAKRIQAVRLRKTG